MEFYHFAWSTYKITISLPSRLAISYKGYKKIKLVATLFEIKIRYKLLGSSNLQKNHAK